MKTIGIQAHIFRTAALELALFVFDEIRARGATPVFENDTAKALGLEQGEDVPEMECIIVIGGDGTMLRGAQIAAIKGIPIIGVNLGKLGFLSEVEPGEVKACVARVIKGDYTVERRMMLRGSVSGRVSGSWLALNDFVLFKKNVSRLMEVEVSINGQVADRYSCDGVIVATATGSTAYSLSAGGPLMLPSANGIIITPISPHKIGPMPIVIGENDIVSIRSLGENSGCSIASDGQADCDVMTASDVLTIRRAKEVAKIMHLKPYRFFDLMRQKLY